MDNNLDLSIGVAWVRIPDGAVAARPGAAAPPAAAAAPSLSHGHGHGASHGAITVTRTQAGASVSPSQAAGGLSAAAAATLSPWQRPGRGGHGHGWHTAGVRVTATEPDRQPGLINLKPPGLSRLRVILNRTLPVTDADMAGPGWPLQAAEPVHS